MVSGIFMSDPIPDFPVIEDIELGLSEFTLMFPLVVLLGPSSDAESLTSSVEHIFEVVAAGF